MNLALAAFGGYPVPTWESQEGAHTPSGSKTPIIICGWLLKMKREHRKFRSTWNRRWFTVEDGAFNWYKTSSSDACGRLSLLYIQSVRRYVGTEHGSYTFVVHATDREMLLRADSANDESRWIRGLTLQTDLVHGGTFQGPPSAKNRRRTVLKLMGEGCTGANGGDGGGGDNKTTGLDQKGDRGGGGGKSREGEWKGEGSQFREINKKIRALMNDHDNRVGGGGSSSTGAAGDNSKPTRFYSERQPAQKFKITPRDPRGISIVGGRGLGKFPDKNGGGGDNGTGARRFSTKVMPISEPPPTRSCVSQQESEGGDGGGGGVNGTSQNVSTASTISSRSSGSNSPEDGRWRVVTGVGARCGSSGGGSGRSKPPMPSGPPPTNIRGVRTAKLVGGGGGGGTGDHRTLSDTASSDEKDNVRGQWRSRSRVVARRAGHEVSRGSGARRSKQHRYSAGGNGGGDVGGRHGSFSHRGARRNAGGVEGRRDRNDFESLHDVSSSEESSSSRTRGEPFMNDYVSAETGRGGSTPRDHPSGAVNCSSTAAKNRRRDASASASTSVSGSGGGSNTGGDAADIDQYHRYPQKKQQQQQQHRYGRRQRRPSHDEVTSGSNLSSFSSSPRSPAAASSSSRQRRRSGRNFDNDDFSRGDGDDEEEEVSVDRTNYWLQSGYAGGNGAAGYYVATAGCSGGGGGGGGSGRSGGSSGRGASEGGGSGARGASGGSATAEDMSWNAGMMGGMSSRSRGSSRGNSGSGSSGRGGSGLPRRYLTEQSMLRQQGW